MAETKLCGRCSESKSLSEFHRNRAARDGRQTYCKTCRNPEVRRWERENPQAKKAIKQRYKERHSAKSRAQTAVHNAVRDGYLEKPEHCEVCGQPGSGHGLQGHHRDYDKPLEVEWLCIGCHSEAHRKERSHA